MRTHKPGKDPAKRNQAVADARRAADPRALGYREQALKLYPWICGRCRREFTHANLHELTVHHRNHNHDDNPADGSNWELLCLYCHDNEHQKQIELQRAASGPSRPKSAPVATGNPLADLKKLMANKAKGP
ncbi:MAG: YajD family HNH nuclease [Nevskiales bacterium]|nr:YajD family HNH nuclease [Nevskiales bacterium]